MSGHGSSTDFGLRAVIWSDLVGEAVNLVSCFVRDRFSRLVSLDPFSVFAGAEKVARLDFYDRVQIGPADGPGAQWRKKSKYYYCSLEIHNVCS